MKKNKGQVMLLTVVLLSGAILSATSIAGLLILFQLRQTSDVTASTKAIFAADSGIECILFRKFRDSSKDCLSAQLSNGSKYKTTGASPSYKSVGMSGRTARSFEITF